ncbi:MAG: hypothetical protein GXP22_04765 [Gammaproteobacteria bacterium]|nr:hypothetical protein [Gammaproteobacteria bacterium]
MPLIIKLQPSKILSSLLIVAYLTTITVLLFSDLPASLFYSSLLLVLWQGYRHYHDYLAHDTSFGIDYLSWQGDGEWRVYFKTRVNNDYVIKTISSVFYCRWFIGFFLQGDKERGLALLIPVDMLDAHHFRQLYVHLKIQSCG